jgi:hypothetical protein
MNPRLKTLKRQSFKNHMHLEEIDEKDTHKSLWNLVDFCTIGYRDS